MQLPFYIASSKAPHRVSRVAEKQLVRVRRLLCPFSGRAMSMARQFCMHVLQAVVHVFDAQPQMCTSIHFNWLRGCASGVSQCLLGACRAWICQWTRHGCSPA